MVYQERLAQKIQMLPPSLLPMVDVFVEFLLTRYTMKPEEDDLDTAEVARIAMVGGAFNWLNDPAEDGIYSDEDGEPV